VFWYEDVLTNKTLTPVVEPECRRGGETMQVEKVDDYTVRFRFKPPHGLFMKRMASNSYEMVTYPRHYLKQYHPPYLPEPDLDEQARARGFDGWHRLFLDLREWRNAEIRRLWAWLCRRPPSGRRDRRKRVQSAATKWPSAMRPILAPARIVACSSPMSATRGSSV